ncbi:MAG: lipo-like protein [Deltaproteobacteria bacterium]|nr:lipo-like protein [Deltaproteobacteria bacterium]
MAESFLRHMRDLVTAPVRAVRQFVIRQLSRILTKPLKNYTSRTPNDLAALKRHIRKGDIVLVEGEQRISEVIKYLTQSSWSHAALYVGDDLMHRQHPQAGQLRAAFGEEADFLLIEALVDSGVVASPLSKYTSFNIRVCRPHNLRKEHSQAILDEVIGQLGYTYDLRNVLDLARYFLPVSLVPRRLRRKALHFGSGLPTQVICSSMIAAAFGKVGFPIVPIVVRDSTNRSSSASFLHRLFPRSPQSEVSPIFRRAHPTLTTPRDFDLSPYFEVVKFNVIESRHFDYSRIVWTEDQEENEEQVAALSLPHP